MYRRKHIHKNIINYNNIYARGILRENIYTVFLNTVITTKHFDLFPRSGLESNDNGKLKRKKKQRI